MKTWAWEVYNDYPVRSLRFFVTVRRDKLVFEAVTRRDHALVALYWCPGNFRVSPLAERRNGLVSEYIKKAMRQVAVAGSLPPTDQHFAETYPALWDFMSVTKIDIGDKPAIRQTATVNVFVQDGFFKAFLNDRESGRSLCVAATTFTGLWDALETALTSDEPQWREKLPEGGTTRQKGRGRPN